MFKGLSGLGNLLKQAQQLGGRMQQLNDDLKNRRATGNAGGAMVEVEVNGLLEVLHTRINPQLIQEGDRELIEDLVTAAVNQAILKAKQLHADAMKELTGGLELPGLDEALAKLGGGAGEGPAKP
jgi:nucleoid-associated protein EbfC